NLYIFSQIEETNTIIIYPFYSIQNDFPEKYSYLKDTIPDMIKQEIINEKKFYLIENEKIFSIQKELNLTSDFYLNEQTRIEVAGKLKADFICWGYFIFEEEKLNVFYIVFDVNSKRTKKIEKAVYFINDEIFKNIEETSKNFSFWINNTLPVLQEKDEFIKTKNDQTKDVSNDIKKAIEDKKAFYFDRKFIRYFQIDTSILYNFYFIPFSQYIRNNFALEVSLRFFIPKATFLYGGISSLIFFMAGKSDNSANDNILMFNIPISLKFGVNLHLLKYLELDSSLGIAASIFAGYLISGVSYYARPAFTFDTNIIFAPIKYFKIGIGVIFTASFYAYQDWTMLNLAPRFTLSASF
ncbi:MAG TPA: hypothetical protein PK771_12760, partial [Spirochaetota bacterium]|nr:hypothetical protein [Spirochaetota bacterium]